MVTRTLTWRALTTGDVPALAQAHAVVEAVDGTGEHNSEQDLRDWLEDESTDLARDTLAAFASDEELVAFARVERPGEAGDVDRVYAEGAVLPGARGRGVGRRLLAWAEGRAAGLHREHRPDLSGAICVVVHDANLSRRWFVRAATTPRAGSTR
jgi:GNAT superfamily N-acetyltransferase